MIRSGTRTTNWTWTDATKSLAYSVTGAYAGGSVFTTITAEYFAAGADTPQIAAAQPLNSTGGSIVFK